MIENLLWAGVPLTAVALYNIWYWRAYRGLWWWGFVVHLFLYTIALLAWWVSL